jgi:hypothetical protein
MISTPMLSGHGMGLSEEQVEQFKKSVLNSVPLDIVYLIVLLLALAWLLL